MMKLMKTTLFTILFLILLAVATKAQSVQHDEVRKADALLNDLIVKHESAKASALYCDDFRLTTSSGKVKTKQDLLDEIALTGLVFEVNETLKTEVSIEGTTAVLRGTLHQKGKYNEKQFDHYLLVTDTWIQTMTGWKLLAGHATLIN